MLNTKPYRVEIHSRDLTCVAHFFVDYISLSDDYLTLTENTIETAKITGVERGYWIHIVRDSFEYFGVVTTVTQGTELTTIGYKPFNSIFAYPVLYDTAVQDDETSAQPALETYIATLISNNWITVDDTALQIPNLNIVTTTNTTNWSLYIEPDTDTDTVTVVELYSSVLVAAMTQYYISVTAIPDFLHDRINVTIGNASLNSTAYAFDAELPNVLYKNVSMFTSSDALNKLVVCWQGIHSVSATFYKYEDGSIGVQDTNRIFPVVYDIEMVQAEDETEFEYQALIRAYSRLMLEGDNNYIELTYLQNDALLASFTPTYGTAVAIHDSDKTYSSILTGIEIDEYTVKYIFGVVRTELTTTLKRRKYNV